MNRVEQARIASGVYNKFCEGDSIPDEDLAIGINHFRALTDMLFPMGSTFRLAAVECNRVLMVLEGFQQARKDFKKEAI